MTFVTQLQQINSRILVILSQLLSIQVTFLGENSVYPRNSCELGEDQTKDIVVAAATLILQNRVPFERLSVGFVHLV